MYTIKHRQGYALGTFKTAGGLAAWLSTETKAGVFPRYQKGRIPAVDSRDILFPENEAWEIEFEANARYLIHAGAYNSGKSTPKRVW